VVRPCTEVEREPEVVWTFTGNVVVVVVFAGSITRSRRDIPYDYLGLSCVEDDDGRRPAMMG
jgi:hypothetical protein